MRALEAHVRLTAQLQRIGMRVREHRLQPQACDQELTAQVVEIEGGGKIRLSLTAAKRAEERAEMDEYMKTQKPKQGEGKKGFGTFADLLKNVKV